MADWSVVIPAKPLVTAKSRLHPPVGFDRQLLVLSMLQDVVAAVSESTLVARLIVLTCDPVVAHAARSQGAEAMREPWPTDLNSSVELATSALAGRRPIAVITGDLPSLRTADVDDVLHLAGEHDNACITDASGTGTTILTARKASLLVPRFGVGSADRHMAAGHQPLPSRATARRDVDTWGDVLDAVRLGVGSHTATALGPSSARAANRLIASMIDTAQETRHVALAG